MLPLFFHPLYIQNGSSWSLWRIKRRIKNISNISSADDRGPLHATENLTLSLWGVLDYRSNQDTGYTSHLNVCDINLLNKKHNLFYTGSFKKIWTIKTHSREEYHITTDQIWRTIHCWMEPHATITVMLGTSLTRHCCIDGLEEQSTMINI